MTSLRYKDPRLAHTVGSRTAFFIPLNDLLQTYRKFPPPSRRVELEATSLDSTLASLSSNVRFPRKVID
jgi:hypothetical protein